LGEGKGLISCDRKVDRGGAEKSTKEREAEGGRGLNNYTHNWKKEGALTKNLSYMLKGGRVTKIRRTEEKTHRLREKGGKKGP